MEGLNPTGPEPAGRDPLDRVQRDPTGDRIFRDMIPTTYLFNATALAAAATEQGKNLSSLVSRMSEVVRTEAIKNRPV